ncbi:MAG: lipid-A-disaccharide synthase N-terminal domain-containing protein [Planctomycetota bacterium]
MQRRWLVLCEVLLLLAVIAWATNAGFAALRERSGEGVDVKVQLDGAEDRAVLHRLADGGLRWRLRSDAGEVLELTPDQFAERVHQDQSSRGPWEVLLNVSSPAGFAWVALGFFGQVLFTGRMLVQWLVSERQKRSVVPVAFWWMSLIGASMLLVYFVWRKEPIGVLGQATGWFVYVRNLWMIHRAGTSTNGTAPTSAATTSAT